MSGFVTQVRASRIAVAGLLAGFSLTGLWATGQEPDNCQTSDAAVLRSLQQERVEILARRHEAVQAQYEVGAGNFRDVILANRQLLDARLDLAADRQEKLVIHLRTIASLKTLEQAEQERHEAGVARLADFLEAQAALLDARIAYHKECQAAR